MTVPAQVCSWVALWGAWIALSRWNHPTLLLDAVASALLVLMFAGAAYANHLLLIPRFWGPRRYGTYGALLLGVLGAFALACTAAIHVAYDGLWGPDPARFGSWANLGMEFGLEAAHVGLIAAGVGMVGRVRPA